MSYDKLAWDKEHAAALKLLRERNELLAALKETVSAVDDELSACGDEEIRQHPTLTRHARISKKAHAVIAKAEKDER